MIYKFKSKAAGDVIMLKATGDRVLAAMGREAAPKGILECEEMPGLLHALQAAIEQDDRARAGPADDDADATRGRPHESGAGEGAMPLRRRAWPLVQMIQRAQAEGHPITWGV